MRERAGGRWPLSVSTDRIGVVALRCAAILDRLSTPVDRDGSGTVAEVYPAAALSVWDIYGRGRYKQSTEVLNQLLDRFTAWLPVQFRGDSEAVCRRSHDAFDAMVCAVVAYQVAVGETLLPASRDEHSVAAVEGWIHVPNSARYPTYGS